MKTIAIISDNPIERQPRVLTEINALKNDFRILIFGEESQLQLPFFKLNYYNNHPTINFHYQWPKLLRKFASTLVTVYLYIYRYCKPIIVWSKNKKNIAAVTKHKPDLVILHGVPHAKWVTEITKNKNIPLIINLHEYYPLEFEDNEKWMKNTKPVYDQFIKRYFSSANGYFVVCNSIIKKYEQEFNFKNQVLIRNTKPFYNLQPISNDGTVIKMIHHGASISSRKIELTIESMRFLPKNYRLDLMLMQDDVYYPLLVNKAKGDTRIRFIPPVPTSEIIPFLNSYDLGLFLLPPVNFNYLNALPNKLFEFIQARLAIVVSPNPEMKSLVDEFNLGAVSKDYTAEEFAKAILKIDTNALNKFKQHSNTTASIINDAEEQKKILKTVKSLLKCVE